MIICNRNTSSQLHVQVKDWLQAIHTWDVTNAVNSNDSENDLSTLSVLLFEGLVLTSGFTHNLVAANALKTAYIQCLKLLADKSQIGLIYQGSNSKGKKGAKVPSLTVQEASRLIDTLHDCNRNLARLRESQWVIKGSSDLDTKLNSIDQALREACFDIARGRGISQSKMESVVSKHNKFPVICNLRDIINSTKQSIAEDATGTNVSPGKVSKSNKEPIVVVNTDENLDDIANTIAKNFQLNVNSFEFNELKNEIFKARQYLNNRNSEYSQLASPFSNGFYSIASFIHQKAIRCFWYLHFNNIFAISIESFVDKLKVYVTNEKSNQSLFSLHGSSDSFDVNVPWNANSQNEQDKLFFIKFSQSLQRRLYRKHEYVQARCNQSGSLSAFNVRNRNPSIVNHNNNAHHLDETEINMMTIYDINDIFFDIDRNDIDLMNVITTIIDNSYHIVLNNGNTANDKETYIYTCANSYAYLDVLYGNYEQFLEHYINITANNGIIDGTSNTTISKPISPTFHSNERIIKCSNIFDCFHYFFQLFFRNELSSGLYHLHGHRMCGKTLSLLVLMKYNDMNNDTNVINLNYSMRSNYFSQGSQKQEVEISLEALRDQNKRLANQKQNTKETSDLPKMNNINNNTISHQNFVGSNQSLKRRFVYINFHGCSHFQHFLFVLVDALSSLGPQFAAVYNYGVLGIPGNVNSGSNNNSNNNNYNYSYNNQTQLSSIMIKKNFVKLLREYFILLQQHSIVVFDNLPIQVQDGNNGVNNNNNNNISNILDNESSLNECVSVNQITSVLLSTCKEFYRSLLFVFVTSNQNVSTIDTSSNDALHTFQQMLSRNDLQREMRSIVIDKEYQTNNEDNANSESQPISENQFLKFIRLCNVLNVSNDSMRYNDELQCRIRDFELELIEKISFSRIHLSLLFSKCLTLKQMRHIGQFLGALEQEKKYKLSVIDETCRNKIIDKVLDSIVSMDYKSISEIAQSHSFVSLIVMETLDFTNKEILLSSSLDANNSIAKLAEFQQLFFTIDWSHSFVSNDLKRTVNVFPLSMTSAQTNKSVEFDVELLWALLKDVVSQDYYRFESVIDELVNQGLLFAVVNNFEIDRSGFDSDKNIIESYYANGISETIAAANSGNSSANSSNNTNYQRSKLFYNNKYAINPLFAFNNLFQSNHVFLNKVRGFPASPTVNQRVFEKYVNHFIAFLNNISNFFNTINFFRRNDSRFTSSSSMLNHVNVSTNCLRAIYIFLDFVSILKVTQFKSEGKSGNINFVKAVVQNLVRFAKKFSGNISVVIGEFLSQERLISLLQVFHDSCEYLYRVHYFLCHMTASKNTSDNVNINSSLVEIDNAIHMSNEYLLLCGVSNFEWASYSLRFSDDNDASIFHGIIESLTPIMENADKYLRSKATAAGVPNNSPIVVILNSTTVQNSNFSVLLMLFVLAKVEGTIAQSQLRLCNYQVAIKHCKQGLLYWNEYVHKTSLYRNSNFNSQTNFDTPSFRDFKEYSHLQSLELIIKQKLNTNTACQCLVM